jgi:hypothetical protein
VSKKDSLSPLIEVLRDLVAWVQNERIPGIVIGGVAASILGRPRMTRDVDMLLLLEEKEWDKCLRDGAKFGFIPRLTDCLKFAKQSRVLLVRHQRSGIDVDITFCGLEFEREAINRATWFSVGETRLPLPTPEDLIIMKAIAHRPKDLADIESILDAQGKLNVRRIRKWVREFSIAIETPEILTDLESVLARRRKK